MANLIKSKRCKHTVSINIGLLKKIFECGNLTYDSIDTEIKFKCDVNTEKEYKELANWLITHSIKLAQMQMQDQAAKTQNTTTKT